jgi:hypothetical protein
VANSGGPSPENKVASAFIEVQTTGVPQVQADLKKVKEATEQATGSQVAGQQKVAEATQKTTGTFADLRAKLNDSVPVAQNLVTTLSDVKGVAEMFFSIGKAIGDMVANVAALQYEAERIKLQGLQADARGQANLQNGPYGNAEAMKAAGVDPRGMSDLDAQIAQQEQVVRRLAAIRAFTESDENPVGSLLSNLIQTATFGNAFSNDPSSPDFTPTFGEEKDAFRNFGPEQEKLNQLRRARSRFAPRIRGGLDSLRGASIEAQNTPVAIQAMTSTPIASDDAMRRLAEALEENTKAINEQRNRPR